MLRVISLKQNPTSPSYQCERRFAECGMMAINLSLSTGSDA
jgi:hypothetical protein